VRLSVGAAFAMRQAFPECRSVNLIQSKSVVPKDARCPPPDREGRGLRTIAMSF
jgi:hypothetical protein